MTNAVSKPGLSQANRTRLVQMGVGALAGAAAAIAGVSLSDFGGVDLDQLGWSDHLALALAAIMIVSAVVIGLSSFSARAAARMLDPESQAPARPPQLTLLRQQAAVMLLAGLMMGAPVLANLVVTPLPVELGVATLAALIALLLLQTGLNFSIWNRGDEMMKGVMSEVATVCFWSMQGALFLWAAAEKLGVAPPLTSWDLMSLLMAFYLLISSVIAARRGFA